MANYEAIQEEADRLYAILNEDYVPKIVMASGFEEYSAESKNEVVARVVSTYAPPPKGALLTRLLFIRTAENEAPMRTIFVANLRSSQADARKFSLYGLKELGHESLQDLALLSMRDDDPQVLTAAVDLLLPDAKSDPSLWSFLQGFYAAHKGQDKFHMSVSLLEAHSIATPLPTD